jgi:hypothetical protein
MKVELSFPREIIGPLNLPNPSSHTTTQSLKEINSMNIPEGETRPARKADIRAAIREPIAERMRESRRLAPLRPDTGVSFTFLLSKSGRNGR